MSHVYTLSFFTTIPTALSQQPNCYLVQIYIYIYIYIFDVNTNIIQCINLYLNTLLSITIKSMKKTHKSAVSFVWIPALLFLKDFYRYCYPTSPKKNALFLFLLWDKLACTLSIPVIPLLPGDVSDPLPSLVRFHANSLHAN